MLRNRAIETEIRCGSGFLARRSSPHRGRDAPPTVGAGFKVFSFYWYFALRFYMSLLELLYMLPFAFNQYTQA